jgi:glycosyltransferase involved in cell wall biosynthesis
VLFAADHFARQQDQIQRVWEDWTATATPTRCEALAVFSDSIGGVDGVAKWCGRFAHQARSAGRRVWFPSCGSDSAANDQRASSSPIPAVKRFKLPLYRDVEIVVPSLPATVDRVWRERVTHVELATPGPMGLAGLAAARILRLPVTASFHTDFAALIETLTDVPTAADLTRAYLGWFYRSVDRVFAFSPASRDALLRMGVKPGNIELADVAVDPQDFCPSRLSHTAFADLGVDVGRRPVVLTVGRLSPEKNVGLIIDAVERLQGHGGAPHLVVVGDGPARSGLEKRCAGKQFVSFVGVQQGDVLRRLYASADAFVFASSVDTLGLVNLEALASGVPLLVPTQSAIAAFLCDGVNALFYEPQPDSLAQALTALFNDPAASSRLVEAGRRLALERWDAARFDRIWHSMTGTSVSRRAA